jgi:hypothetical protein
VEYAKKVLNFKFGQQLQHLILNAFPFRIANLAAKKQKLQRLHPIGGASNAMELQSTKTNRTKQPANLLQLAARTSLLTHQYPCRRQMIEPAYR